MTRPLDGRVALVTGGATGIGRAVAAALTRAGATCRLVGRRPEVLEAGAAALERASAHACDVGEWAAVAALVTSLEPIDILVNAAGTIHAAPVHELDPERVEAVVRTNLLGAFHTCRAVLPGMRVRGRGDVVNVSSVAASRAFPTMGAYAASKAGLEALSAAIRAESREAGVRVLDVVAGAVSTDLWDGFWPDAPRERMLDGDDVARGVLAALVLPAGASVERIVVRPTGGDL